MLNQLLDPEILGLQALIERGGKHITPSPGKQRFHPRVVITSALASLATV